MEYNKKIAKYLQDHPNAKCPICGEHLVDSVFDPESCTDIIFSKTKGKKVILIHEFCLEES